MIFYVILFALPAIEKKVETSGPKPPRKWMETTRTYLRKWTGNLKAFQWKSKPKPKIERTLSFTRAWEPALQELKAAPNQRATGTDIWSQIRDIRLDSELIHTKLNLAGMRFYQSSPVEYTNGLQILAARFRLSRAEMYEMGYAEAIKHPNDLPKALEAMEKTLSEKQ